MKNAFAFITFILLFCFWGTAQSITLINDTNPGSSGSIRGETAQFKKNIYYVGFKSGEFGNSLLKYDVAQGTVLSVSPVFSTSSQILRTTEQRLYISDDETLYYIEESSDDLVEVAQLSGGRSIEQLFACDDVLVIVSETSDFRYEVYVIRDDMEEWKKISTTPIDEDLVAEVGNEFITVRSVGNSADYTVGNFLIEKSTLDVVDPQNVFEHTTCTQFANMLAVDDYILYDCLDGTRYIYNIQEKSHTELSGFTREIRNGENHIFMQSGSFFFPDLYSFNKSTGEEIKIANDILDLGVLNEERTTLYYFKDDSDLIYTTQGDENDVVTFNNPYELKNGSKITNVLTFGDIIALNFELDLRDFWSLQIKDGEVIPLNESSDFGSLYMPFYKVDNKLVFSYKDQEYGAELFSVDFLASSTDEKEQQVLSVYPLPTSGIINIEGIQNDDSIEILDFAGKVLLKPLCTNGQIDISFLPNGVYFLTVKNILNHKINKIIKQ